MNFAENQSPVDNQITNSDESKKLPDDNPDPIEGAKTDEFDNQPEGTTAEGNVAAKKEEDTRKVDGSTANNMRTK